MKNIACVMLLGIFCLLGTGCATSRTVAMCYGADGNSMSQRGFVTIRDIRHANYVQSQLSEIMGPDKRSMFVNPRSRYVEIEIFSDMKREEADAYGKKIEEFRAKHPEVYPIKLIVSVLPDEPAN